jgi:hypothetical protein
MRYEAAARVVLTCHGGAKASIWRAPTVSVLRTDALRSWSIGSSRDQAMTLGHVTVADGGFASLMRPAYRRIVGWNVLRTAEPIRGAHWTPMQCRSSCQRRCV